MHRENSLAGTLPETLGLASNSLTELEDLFVEMLDKLERIAGVMERFEAIMNPTLGGGGRVGEPPAAARQPDRRRPS